MGEHKKRARQLELMKVHIELRQRKIGRQLRTFDDAIIRTEHLGMQLDRLNLQYAEQETSGGISALALGSIRRKQAEMGEAIEQQRGRLEGLQSERLTLVRQAGIEAQKVERITQLLAANSGEQRRALEKKRDAGVVRSIKHLSQKHLSHSGLLTAVTRDANGPDAND